MLNLWKVLTVDNLSAPQFKTENGVRYKLDHFEQTDDGFVPVYAETNEVSDEEALAILLGEEGSEE